MTDLITEVEIHRAAEKQVPVLMIKTEVKGQELELLRGKENSIKGINKKQKLCGLLLFAYFNTTFFAPNISERVSTNSCVGETKRFCGARSFAPVLSI